MKNLRSDIMTSLFTILLVVYFAQGTGLKDYIPAFLDAQLELADFVTKSVGSDDKLCPPPPAAGDPPLDWNVWQRLDCTIAHVVGIETTYKDGSTLKAKDMSEDPYNVQFLRSHGTMGTVSSGTEAVLIPAGVETFAIFTIATGVLFSGLGPLIFVLAAAIPLMLIAAFVQAAFIYITSYFAIIFLAIIGPIIIPLVLFGVTRQIFFGWLQMIIGFTLKPMFLLAYLAFMSSVLQYVIPDLGRQYDLIRVAPPQMQDLIDSTAAVTVAGVPSTALSATTTKLGSATSSVSFPKIHFYNGIGVTSPPTTSAEMITAKQSAEEALAKHKKEMKKFMYNLLIVAIVLAITLGFMHNVIGLGDELSGVSGTGKALSVNIYNRTIGAIAAAMK